MKHFLLVVVLLFACNVSANTDRYRLMFNTDPSTEITLGWEQVSSSNPEVYYGTVDHGTNWANYPNSQTPYRQVNYQGMDNRFALLTGLTPNTIYYFVIKDDAGTSQRYWFKTCPNVNTETLSFVSGGDSRSGSTQRRNSNRMVAKIRPHAVLFGGDLQNTPSNAVMQEWLDDWQLTITSDGQMIPVVHSYGNHEEYGNGGPNLIRDLFDTNYDVYYNLRFGGDLFSMYTLNGEVLPGHTIANNTVRVAQRNWLNTELQADNSIWKGAQYHRPIVPHYSGKGEGADEFYDWANLFYEYGVRLVMESDAHVVKLTEEVRPDPSYTGVPFTSPSGSSSNWFTTTGLAPNKGITFIGEGTWGTIRTPDDTHPMTTATTSLYGFNWVLVDACKIEIRTIDTQNPNAVPEHAPGDYTSISAGLDAQIWKPGAMPSGLREIVRCNPPIVDFSASATNVFTGTNINFTDLTANNPTTWSWDFGDGIGTSTAQNPSYTYATAGTYTVTLTCTNVEGSDTETKVSYIVVSDPVAPTADFVADITSASVGQTITFTDLTVGVPSSWSWNFGDANTSTAQNPTHSYATPGVYTVTLTATNAYGNNTETKTSYITVNAGGSVAVTISTGTDDAEEFRVGGIAGDMYLTSSDLEIGNDGGDEQYVGLRFQNVNVPQGAIISNAYIRFRADENDGSGSQLNIYVAAHDIDDAPAFTTGNYNLSGRTFTTAQYTWPDGSVPAWTNPNIYDTPDLSAVVQEVVDRGGWTNGNSMALFLWSDIGESSERVADSYEGGYPAELIFDYTIPTPTAPVAALSANNPTICIGENVNFTDNSTNNPTSWSWNFGDGNSSSTQSPSHTFNTAGVFTVTLTSSNAGGSDSETTTITVNGLPAVNASGATSICEGQSTSISASGASTYAWDNGVNTASQSVSPTTNATYTVTGTDGNGCTNTDQVTVSVNSLPAVAASGTTSICEGESTSISASGASTYAWDNGVNTASQSVSPTTNATYTVTGTDGNGCTNTDQVAVSVNSLPAVAASGTTSICEGQSTSISASGASTYAWDNGVNTASQSVSPTTNATYTVTGTDGNGCTNTDQVTVSVNSLPAVAASGTTSICEGQSTSISASGASTYAWDNGVNTASQSVSPTTNATYTVTGTDGNGCTNTDQVTVSVNSLPAVAASGTTSICEGQSTSISASGASTYAWDNGVNTASQSVSPTTNATYTVTGTDGNGCTNTDQVTVSVNSLPAVAASGTTSICEGQSTSISASGASTYAWDNGVNTASQSVSPTTNATYTVTGTDGNGCTNTDQVTVSVNALPVIATGLVTDPTACATATGAIEISGTGTGDISWTGTASGSQNGVSLPYSIPNLAAGSYNVTFVDANGCTSNALSTLINDPNPPTTPVVTSNGNLTLCDGESVVLSSSYATGVTWSTSETTQDISVSSAGTYSVTYTDAQGCSSTSTPIDVIVNSLPAIPTISANGAIEFCDGEDVTLSSSYATGNEWSTLEVSQDIVVTTSGNYTVAHTDANGCSSTSSAFEVIVHDLPAVSLLPFVPEVVCINDDNIQLPSASPIGGNYAGSGISGIEFIPFTAGEGTHVITYTYVDVNGCENSATQEITVESCLSLEELSEIGYLVYPNPSDDIVYIERKEGNNMATISIYDASGRLVLSTTSEDNPIALDVKNWAPGNYTIQITIDAKSYASKLVIK